MFFTKKTICSEITPLYHSWKQAVEEVKKAKDSFQNAGAEDNLQTLKENLKQALIKAQTAKEAYFKKKEENTQYEDKTIILKDALILEYYQDVGINGWREENGRVVSLNLDDKDLSHKDNSPFPDGLQRLYLDRATLPSNITFPDGLQILWLDRATLPSNITFPDGLKYLYLNKVKLPPNTTPEEWQEKLREYRQRNPNVRIIGG
ncbi:MAG: hypothetical protein ACOCU8_02895 [Patescibacteria group bacterium]